MWKRLEVDRNKQYYVWLTQRGRFRGYSLGEVGAAEPPEDAVFRTADPIPFDLLWWQNVEEIGKKYPLTNGEYYKTEAHAMWLTVAEVQALFPDDDDYSTPVPWVTGVAPIFPFTRLTPEELAEVAADEARISAAAEARRNAAANATPPGSPDAPSAP